MSSIRGLDGPSWIQISVYFILTMHTEIVISDHRHANSNSGSNSSDGGMIEWNKLIWP